MNEERMAFLDAEGPEKSFAVYAGEAKQSLFSLL
jgi:hypothetical protein